MDKFEELKLTAVKVNLRDTITFIEEFSKLRKAKIKSETPTINGLEIEFKKGSRCINFSTGPILLCDEMYKYQDSNYGFMNPFKIIENNKIYDIKNGAGASSIKAGKDFSSEGELWELEDSFTEGTGFFRAILPMNGFAKNPVNYLLGQHFLVESSLRYAGYINIFIDNNEIDFFDYSIDKNHYLFIDCKNRIEYSIFELLLESVIYSFALISGSLLRDEITILKFDSPDFSKIIGHQFRKIEESIFSSMELINPREHKIYEELKNTIYFPIDIFSKLANSCFSLKPFLRSIKIITQARNQPVEIQAASIFVALETIKNIIIEENIDNISPFVSQDIAKETIIKLKNIVSDISEKEFNDKRSVLRKIENLNRVGNNDSFKLAFKLVGFELTKLDLDCIAMRNRFLHGNIPFENEPEQRKKKELQNIVLYAHLLTCSLILKYVGYNGVVKNFLKHWDLINGVTNNLPLFRSI